MIAMMLNDYDDGFCFEPGCEDGEGWPRPAEGALHNYRHSGESRNPEGLGVRSQSGMRRLNPLLFPLGSSRGRGVQRSSSGRGGSGAELGGEVCGGRLALVCQRPTVAYADRF